jgi:ceramide glucosyltransferase
LIAVLAAGYLALTAVRFGLALRYARLQRRVLREGPLTSVTVLQPILSGDPDMEGSLRANVQENHDARFIWLVDDDDPAGIDIGTRLARPNVVIGPGPLDGENPKLAKLDRGLALVDSDVVVVLDDDTRIGRRELSLLVGALVRADLVTGLPVFVADRTIYERFVGGFVNGNAMLTYLPAAALGVQRTINGMVYAVRAKELRGLGGFACVKESLTDDYAMAQLYARAGRRVLQAPVFVRVTMTIAGPGHCGRVMRRWLIFANLYLRENASVATLVLVALPALLPLAGLITAIFAGHLAVLGWLGCLVVKALGNRWLLFRFAGYRSGLFDVVFEIASDLLLPMLYVSSLVRPKQLSWRTRNIALSGGRIKYLR